MTNLTAYYKLEDISDSWASYDLTNNGTTTFDTGKINNAANLGTSNSTKWLSTTDPLGINGGTMSVSFWAKVLTAPGIYYLFTQENDNTGTGIVVQ